MRLNDHYMCLWLFSNTNAYTYELYIWIGCVDARNNSAIGQWYYLPQTIHTFSFYLFGCGYFISAKRINVII